MCFSSEMLPLSFLVSLTLTILCSDSGYVMTPYNCRRAYYLLLLLLLLLFLLLLLLLGPTTILNDCTLAKRCDCFSAYIVGVVHLCSAKNSMSYTGQWLHHCRHLNCHIFTDCINGLSAYNTYSSRR